VCLRVFNESPGINVVGTFWSEYDCNQFPYKSERHYVLSDALNVDQVEVLFERFWPSVVINCASLSKNRLYHRDPLELIPICALLPHMFANFCSHFTLQLIQISGDGVFSGDKGNYGEEDIPDLTDLYVRAKLLGEVVDRGCITLRTSGLGMIPSYKTD